METCTNCWKRSSTGIGVGSHFYCLNCFEQIILLKGFNVKTMETVEEILKEVKKSETMGDELKKIFKELRFAHKYRFEEGLIYHKDNCNCMRCKRLRAWRRTIN